ncbi:Protein TsgA [Buchnera aphidicola (Eriosoma grossulariae)]|uniref:MFS transporter TsgA n=1 Tax=Buchnera aphidicola TaxID=9 RepID=UPI003464888F
MIYKNKISLTLISFFSYFLTGSLVIVTGMIMGNIAKFFNTSLSSMSYTFTILNFGILMAICLNTWIKNYISFKIQIYFGYICIIVAILALIYSKNLIIFSMSMFILGIVSGITMSIGTFFITYLYDGHQRAIVLLITDSFFSMAGMVFPFISSMILSYQKPWYWIYILIGIIYSIIFIIAINTNFPQLNNYLNNKKTINQKKPIKINIIILSISATCYILGQLGFISWIPEYIMQTKHLTINQAGKLVSYFWMLYMIGMWIFSIILNFINIKKLFLFLTGTSTILMYLFINNQEINKLEYLIALLGFFSSAIYTIIITLASLQTKKPSVKNINLILISGTIGTLLTFIITSVIVEKKGIYAVLITSNILYAIVFILSITLNFFTINKSIIKNYIKK